MLKKKGFNEFCKNYIQVIDDDGDINNFWDDSAALQWWLLGKESLFLKQNGNGKVNSDVNLYHYIFSFSSHWNFIFSCN